MRKAHADEPQGDDVRTVGELQDFLAAHPRDRKVIIQKDAEGNGYSPMAGADDGMYAAETTWSGEVYRDGEVPDGTERVVVLWPVN